MRTRQRVAISEIKAARAPDVLVAYGLGSCLGLCLYDPVLRIGGMAHTLLPAHRPGADPLRPGKFVDSALHHLLAILLGMGAKHGRLVAKLAGGANMFEALGAPGRDHVGARNIHAARSVLKNLDLPLIAEESGGGWGRTAEFLLASGEMRVRRVSGGHPVVIL